MKSQLERIRKLRETDSLRNSHSYFCGRAVEQIKEPMAPKDFLKAYRKFKRKMKW